MEEREKNKKKRIALTVAGVLTFALIAGGMGVGIISLVRNEMQSAKVNTFIEYQMEKDAEAQKQREILLAEADRAAKICAAEGEAEAILKIQEATAEGIKKINEAAPTENVIAIKSLEAFGKAADGKATKIIIPSDIASLAGLATSVSELLKNDVK